MQGEASVVQQNQTLKSKAWPLQNHVTMGPLRKLSLDFFNP